MIRFLQSVTEGKEFAFFALPCSKATEGLKQEEETLQNSGRHVVKRQQKDKTAF